MSTLKGPASAPPTFCTYMAPDASTPWVTVVGTLNVLTMRSGSAGVGVGVGVGVAVAFAVVLAVAGGEALLDGRGLLVGLGVRLGAVVCGAPGDGEVAV